MAHRHHASTSASLNESLKLHVLVYSVGIDSLLAVHIDELGVKWVDEGNITHGAWKGNSGTGYVDGVPRSSLSITDLKSVDGRINGFF